MPLRGRYVVTGPTGWIGQAVVSHLARRIGPDWRDRVELFASSERRWEAPDGRPACLRALQSVRARDLDGVFVVHLAHPGRERAQELGPAPFWETSRAIDGALLRALELARPSALLVASSGAAAGAERGQDQHPYAVSKLQQERDFAAWSVRSRVPLRLARIWTVAGPHMTKASHYALGDFATSAISRGVVDVRTPSPVVRSYLHVRDLAVLALEAPWSRTGGAPVDLCGEREVEVGELAEVVASAVTARTGRDVCVRRARRVSSPPQVYLGDPRWVREAAARLGEPLADLEQQVADTVADLLVRMSLRT